MNNQKNFTLIILCYSLLFYYSLFSYGLVSITGAAIKVLTSGLTILIINSFLKKSITKTVVTSVFTANFAILLYISMLYGRFTSGMFASVLESNTQETYEHLTSLDPVLLTKTVLFSCIFYYAAINITTEKKPKTIISLLLICIAIVGVTHVKKQGITGTRISENIYRQDGEEWLINTLSANANILILASWYEYQSLAQLTLTDVPSQWSHIGLKGQPSDVYIVVIGESAIKDKFAFYGYNRPTTPPLTELPFITLVKDPIAPSVVTRTSLPRMFYINDVKTINYGLNIIDLAKQAGFKTYWISNQGVTGNHDTPISAIAKKADSYKFLNSNYELAKNDNVFLDELDLIIADTSTKDKLKRHQETSRDLIQSKVIFLHTMGSHNDFCDRIKGSQYTLPAMTTKHSAVSSMTECYDNSILNTYQLLENIKLKFDKLPLSYKITYFSDHGLVNVKSSPYLSHGSGKLFSKKALEVPLLFIDPLSTQARTIDTRYYLSDFPHTFADWLGIHADLLDSRRSILSQDFTPELQTPKVIDDTFTLKRLPSGT